MTRGVHKVLLLALFALVLLVGAPSATAVGPCQGQDEPIVTSNVEQSERSLLCLVNSYRVENALGALAHDPALRRAARGHSEDMVARGYFDHTSPEGKNVRDRAVEQGYPENSGFGENIGLDQAATPFSMFDAWRDSPGHNANMLDPEWVNAGMGFATGTPPPHPGTEGATGTQAFGTAETGATDTASDLLVTRQACTRARARRKATAQRVRKARRRVRQAESAKQKQRAKRHLRRNIRRLRSARARARSACAPTRF